jgi:replicative DNA helicase
MISNRVLSSLRENREKRLRGDIIAIPWGLERLSKVIPGVEKSRYSLITGSTKSGKTQLSDYLFAYEPIEWFIQNKPKEKRLKVIYFSLEMNKEAKILQAISYKLNRDYSISIAPQNLKSTFAGYVLNPEILKVIESDRFQQWLKEYESYIVFIDDVRSPDKIHKFVKGYAEKHGSYTYKEPDIIDEYIPNHKDEYIIIICDHLSLLSPDNGDTLHGAIYKYSAYHCLEFRDRFKYIVANVQQQSFDSSRQQFDYKGNSVIEKIRPTPEGLADCKLTGRDCDLMLSLFNPYSYNLDEYERIDLTRIGRWHRELYINLNRNGIANAKVQLYFNGAVNEFQELPRELQEEDYKFYLKKTHNLIQ